MEETAEIPEHIKNYRHKMVGAPRIYTEVDDMQKHMENYFAWADYKGFPYTMPDMALFLGFSSVQSLWEYIAYSDAFSEAIKKAKLVIEAQRTRALIQCRTSPVGIIFDLKNNFGWKDVSTVEHSGTVQLGADDLARKLGSMLRVAYKLGVIEPPTIDVTTQDDNALTP
jgi:hypothetical protein